MTKTAAVAYELRWRKTDDPENQWAGQMPVPATGDITVPGLDDSSNYTFEARAISACGAKSAWATQTKLVDAVAGAPQAPTSLTASTVADGVHLVWTVSATEPSNVEYEIQRANDSSGSPSGWATLTKVRALAYTDAFNDGALHWYRVRAVDYLGSTSAFTTQLSAQGFNVTGSGGLKDVANTAATNATAALAAAADANDAIADIADDGLLTPAEKKVIIREYSVITGEQSGIDTQATTFGITTAKADYDSAVSALTTYLGTLTSATDWNDLSGNTTIVRDTFEGKFNTVYLKRQVLLNAIYVAAKALADAAQHTADTAVSNGDDARAIANTKIQSYVTSGAAPTAPSGGFTVGDFWTRTDTWTTTRWNGSSWSTSVGDVTAQHTAADTSKVNGVAAADVITPGQNLLVNASGQLGTAGWSVTGNCTLTIVAHSWGNTFHLTRTGTGTIYAYQTVTGIVISAGFSVAAQAKAWIAGGTGAVRLDAEFSDGTNTADAINTTTAKNLLVSTGGPSATSTYARFRVFTTDETLTDIEFILPKLEQGNATPHNDVGTGVFGAAVRIPNLGKAFVDFGDTTSGGHVGKHLGNIPDDATSHRAALDPADIFASGGYNRLGLRIAGSGQQIGDARQLPPTNTMGVSSVLSTSPVTYTISGTTVTFSAAAFSVYNAGVTISYSAASCSVTQSAGTTVTYYLYFSDPTYAGGAQTMHATTSIQTMAQSAGVVNIANATVTVNAGGGGTGGGGSGGGGWCVSDDMFVAEGRRAGDAEIGDPFDCIDLPTQAGKHVRALQGVSRGVEECVRMITSDGCALVCSLSTPFDLPDGRYTTAPHMLGEQVITDLGTATVTSLALVGPRPVTRAHLGGVSYAAGSDPSRRIYSHNGSIAKP